MAVIPDSASTSPEKLNCKKSWRAVKFGVERHLPFGLEHTGGVLSQRPPVRKLGIFNKT